MENINQPIVNNENATDDIFTMNIFESAVVPETKDELPGANVPKLQEEFDDTGVSVPSKTEISEDAYNAAIDNLQKTFNEAFDTLKSIRPVSETIEDLQSRFTENAIIDSYCNGPYFEAATRADRDDIKKAVAKIKDKVNKGSKDLYTLKPVSVFSYIYGRAGHSRGPQRKWIGIGMMNPIIWQMCGVFFCHANEVDAAIEHYKTKFADEIGDLTFNVIRCNLTLADLYGKKAKGADGQSYILLVDTKRDKVMKEIELPSEDELKKEDAANKADDTSSVSKK